MREAEEASDDHVLAVVVAWCLDGYLVVVASTIAYSGCSGLECSMEPGDVAVLIVWYSSLLRPGSECDDPYYLSRVVMRLSRIDRVRLPGVDVVVFYASTFLKLDWRSRQETFVSGGAG